VLKREYSRDYLWLRLVEVRCIGHLLAFILKNELEGRNGFQIDPQGGGGQSGDGKKKSHLNGEVLGRLEKNKNGLRLKSKEPGELAQA